MLKNLTSRLLLTFFVLWTACGTPSKKTEEKEVPDWTEQPIPLAGQELEAYREILALYKGGAYEPAIARLRRFYAKHKGSAHLAQIQNLHGLIHLQRKDYDKALFRFQQALKVDSSPYIQQFIHYNLATAYYGLRKYGSAEKVMTVISPDQLTRGTRIKYFYMQGLLLSRRKRYLEALSMYLKGSAYIPRSEKTVLETDLRKFEAKVISLLEGVKDPSILKDLYRHHEQTSLAGLIVFKLGEMELAMGRHEDAEKYFKLIISDYPESSKFTDSMERLRGLSQQRIVNPRTVGVLLPLAGADSKFARKALNGIELAFRIFNENEPSSNVTLVVEDSGNTPEDAVKALEKLFYDHHVVAVLGPLHSKKVEAVTQRAQELGVPLMSLAQKEGIMGDYIFNSAVSLKHQCYEIARHAIQVEGMKRFAVIYPDNRFGQLQAEYFWDAVEEMGGEVTAAEAYKPGAVDVNLEVKKIVGLHYMASRQREMDALAELRERDGIKKRTHRTEQYYKLEPVVEFDAVFVPDDAKTVAQVLPTFAYHDVDNVKFLGTSTWNSPIFLRRAADYGPQSLFTSAFYPESESIETRSFVDRFKKFYGSKPQLLEAMAFDAASLLENVLLLSDSSINRREIRDRLTEIHNFPGVTGQISFKQGLLTRNLKVLTVAQKKFREVL